MLRDIAQSSQRLYQDSNGILLFYDYSRSKFLSTLRESLSFGINHRNISANQWLFLTGKIPSNVVGYKIPRDATITAITIQTKKTKVI